MRTYVVWRPDRGETRHEGRKIDAEHPQAACEKWAEVDDWESAEFSIARGNAAELMAAELGSHLAPFRYSVIGEAVPSYRASMLHGKAKP